MEDSIHASYRIPTSRVDGLEKTLIKLAKRIAKGKTEATPPVLEDTRNVILVKDNGTILPFNQTRKYTIKAKFLEYTWVTIKYQRPSIDGWKLIAVYDWDTTDDGRVCYVSTVPSEMTPLEYREVESEYCDHCSTRRQRNKSMLITKNYIDYKVVGSTCIKDFLGHKSPELLIKMFSFEETLYGYSLEEPSYLNGTNEALCGVEHILTIAAMFTNKFGYVKAYGDGMSTALRVERYLFPITEYDFEINTTMSPTSYDITMAKDTMEWIRNDNGVNDYMANLIKAVNAGAISLKRFGVVVSAVTSFKRHVKRTEDEEVKATRSNNWIGLIKVRLKGLVATVADVRITDGYYGETTIVTLLTGTGDTLKWFSSVSIDVERGDVWTLDGTVKAHDEFRDTKQTVLTRVKFVPFHEKVA